MRCFRFTAGGVEWHRCREAHKVVNWDYLVDVKPSPSPWMTVTWELTPPLQASPQRPIPTQSHSPSTTPRPRGTSRPREYTARAMRRVSTRSPSTIPASTPGLTTEQLQSGNVYGQESEEVNGSRELGGRVRGSWKRLGRNGEPFRNRKGYFRV